MTSEALTAERCAHRARLDLRPARLPRAPRQHAHGAPDGALRRRGAARLRGDHAAALLRAPRGRSAAAAHRRAAARALRGRLPRAARGRRLRARALAAPLGGALGDGQLGEAGRGGVRRPRHGRRHPHGLDRRWRWRGSASRGSSRPAPARSPTSSRRPRRSTAARASCSRSRRSSSSSATGASAAGRRSSAACSACGPLLTLVEGEVEPLGRVRGHARLLAELERLVCEDTRGRRARCGSASRTPRPRRSRTTSPRRCAARARRP